MIGFRTQTITTGLPEKWGRAQIVTTQDRTESRFQYWSSIRMIAQPGCQGTFDNDNIQTGRNSELERHTKPAQFSDYGSLCNENNQ